MPQTWTNIHGCLCIPLELLLEDSDDEVKRMVLQKADDDSSAAKFSLGVLLEKESECSKLLGVMLQNQRTDMYSTEKKR